MQNTVEATIEITETLVEASREMLQLFREGDTIAAISIGTDMRKLLEQLQGEVDKNDPVPYRATLWKMYGNALYSLGRILKHCITDAGFALKKTEFELLPLLRATHVYGKYHAMIAPLDKDTRSRWMESEGYELTRNEYYEKGKETGEYKYDLSISVTAFNKMEVTKKCIDHLMRNLPDDLTYEIILNNHGSSDGTKEFFESIHPDKQLDWKYNGGAKITGSLIFEGKYLLGISNDVLMTPGSIEALYHAIADNSDVGYVVPMTSGVSNYQTPEINGIHFEFHDESNVDAVSGQYNRSNRHAMETRFRLINPLYIIDSDILHIHSLHGLCWQGDIAFPDDRVSMFCRRVGLKNVFVKNIYCHHFGSMTLRDEKIDYNTGRREFLEKYGIDPWGRGMCWSSALFQILKCDRSSVKKILGIDCGMGSDPLKIQQDLKQHTGEPEAELVCFSRNIRYVPELMGFCDTVYGYESWSDVFETLDGGDRFDYIIIEDHAEGRKNVVQRIYDEILTENGCLVLFVPDTDKIMAKWLHKTYKDKAVCSGPTELQRDIDEKRNVPLKGKFWIVKKFPQE